MSIKKWFSILRKGLVIKMSVLEHEPFTAKESDRPALNKIKRVLNDSNHVPKLVGPDGEEIELPRSVFHVLQQVVYHMIRGRAIFIVPEHKELTTQEAADILNVSRPYLIKLLEQNEIPFVKVGTHRRILFSELMNYKKLRDAERRRGLDEMARMSQEFGLYD
jgi:excisionase family DNA binding protein